MHYGLTLVSDVLKVDDWNDYRIHAYNGRIKLYINNSLMVDYTEKDPNIPQKGIIGLQVHGGGRLLIKHKDIVIRKLE